MSALGGYAVGAAHDAAKTAAYIGRGDGATDLAQGPQTGLVRIAEQVATATAQVAYIADKLTSLSLGIHGPRPENGGVNSQSAVSDSLAGRVALLLETTERLSRSYESVVG